MHLEAMLTLIKSSQRPHRRLGTLGPAPRVGNWLVAIHRWIKGFWRMEAGIGAGRVLGLSEWLPRHKTEDDRRTFLIRVASTDVHDAYCFQALTNEPWLSGDQYITAHQVLSMVECRRGAAMTSCRIEILVYLHNYPNYDCHTFCEMPCSLSRGSCSLAKRR